MNMYEKLDLNALISAVGDHDDEAFVELVKRYSPLMNKVISGFADTSLSPDDLFAEATVALHSAALHFDHKRQGITFGLFARICIHRRLIDHLRREEVSHDIVDMDVEVVEAKEQIAEELALRERIESLLSGAKRELSDYEYKVLMLHIQGFKTAAIAEKLGKNAKSVDNAKARIFRRLRELYGSEEI